jgi:hypothetical protein
MAPFALAAHLLAPPPAALLGAAGVVSAFNLAVHAPSVAAAWTPPAWWVDPRVHLEHHRTRARHYFAPTLDLGRVPPAPLLVGAAAVALLGRGGGDHQISSTKPHCRASCAFM